VVVHHWPAVQIFERGLALPNSMMIPTTPPTTTTTSNTPAIIEK
jgi:hypothetical protein